MATTQKRQCPICSKSLSYAGAFSKHGYQIKHHQHDMGICFGAYKPEEGLLDAYVKFLENQASLYLDEFPGDWLGKSVFGAGERNQKVAWIAFKTYGQIQYDLKYFAKKVTNG
jgi:hypothetical protein